MVLYPPGFDGHPFICIYISFSRKEKVEATSTPAMSSVITRYGNKSRVNLPDGSVVWLNAGSRLDYAMTDFTKTKREVILSGEAYFEIAHNASIPFFVRSGKMQIKVLGTTFNVKAYPEDNKMETSLIRGSVEITIKDRPDDIYILKPNEKLVVSNDDIEGKTANAGYKPTMINVARDIVALRTLLIYRPGSPETAWVQNKVFRSEKFIDLAVKMERWYGIKIMFRNPEKENLMFTGIFTTETIIQALTAMGVVHPFHFTVDKDTIYID
jgi:ferric-dicitrate binding protein FerR (iron transport regulator)